MLIISIEQATHLATTQPLVQVTLLDSDSGAEETEDKDQDSD